MFDPFINVVLALLDAAQQFVIENEPILSLLWRLAALALVVWAITGWYTWAQALPAGAARIMTHSRSGDTSGRLQLVLVGSFGVSLGVLVLRLIEVCGQQGAIGSILVLELDRRGRTRFLKEAPACFRAKIVAASTPALPGGFNNAPPDAVLNLRSRWAWVVQRAVERACALHRRNQQQVEDAALVLAFISLGGHAAVGAAAIKMIKEEFPLARFVGFSALPAHDRLRRHAKRIFLDYVKSGIESIMLSDNTVGNVLAPDLVMAGIIAGLATAAEEAEQRTQPNNVWSLFLPEQPQGLRLISYTACARTVPGFVRCPAWILRLFLQPRFWTMAQAVATAIQNGLEAIRTHPEYHALGIQGPCIHSSSARPCMKTCR